MTTTATSIEGYVDQADGFVIAGWAADRAKPHNRVIVDAYLAGQVIASASAEHFRPDLAAAGIGDGHHGFACHIDSSALDPAAGPITIRVRNSDRYLEFHGSKSVYMDSSVFLRFVAADIVNNCNLRCPFCVVDYSNVTKTELMTEATFRRLIELMPCVPDGQFFLSCLHEPTLHPGLNKFIDLIPRNLRRKIWFTTNLARPLTEDVFAGWAESGMDHINVSLDSLDPELFAVLRKFGRFSVFKQNLDLMARVFNRYPNPPRLRFITVAFRSNLHEIPEIVRYSHEHWRSSENEIRYTINVSHITDDFRKEHYLHKADWDVLGDMLKHVPYPHMVVFPPNDGYEEVIEASANYFDLQQIGGGVPPSIKFERPISLRARPDGTLMVAGAEDKFAVNINSLPDPVRFFKEF